MPNKDVKIRREVHRVYMKNVWYPANKKKHLRYVRVRKRKLSEWLKEIKSKLHCSQCPEKHIACLEFHHKNSKRKDLAIARAIRNGWSIKRLLREIEKCEVLCANCHRKEHFAG